MPEGRQIMHRKRAHDDPLLRALLDKSLTAEERDSVEVVKGAKSSPLINETATRARVSGAPTTQPLSGSGRDSGSPVPPAVAVSSRDHAHEHSHVGTSAGPTSDPFPAAQWGAYTHSHPHEHPVRRDPADRSVETHDTLVHFAAHAAMVQKHATLHKMAESHPDPQIRRGAQEALKGSIEPGQAADPVPGAPAASRGVTSPSGASAGYCPNRSCSCGGCGPSCTGDCCVACTMGDELDRRETMHFSAVAQLVKDAQAWQEEAEHNRDFYQRQYARERVKGIAAEIRKLAGVSDDVVIEKAAASLQRAVPDSGGIVRKAATVSAAPFTGIDPQELARVVRAAVEKSVRSLDRRVEDLNQRAQ